MLKSAYLFGALSFVTFAVAAHTLDIGSLTVEAACAESETANRPAFPWGNAGRTVASANGIQQVMVTVLPTKFESEQTEVERSVLNKCTTDATVSFSLEELTYSVTETDSKLTNRINSCLANSGMQFSVRLASLRKGSIECGQGGGGSINKIIEAKKGNAIMPGGMVTPQFEEAMRKLQQTQIQNQSAKRALPSNQLSK